MTNDKHSLLTPWFSLIDGVQPPGYHALSFCWEKCYALCEYLPCLLLLMCSGTACGDLITFSNATPITIRDNAIAIPYPSAIVVSGVVGNPTSISITLSGLNHTFPDDIAAVVRLPSRTAVLLFSGPGDFNDAVNLKSCVRRQCHRGIV